MKAAKNVNKKYFLAIVVPDPAYQKIETIKQDLFTSHHLKGALRSPAHITLHRPFEWKEEKEQVLIAMLRTFSFRPAFVINLNGFACFEPRVIFVNVDPSEEIKLLYTRLRTFCQKELLLQNEVNDERGFHPHVTVAFRDLKKPKFYELWTEYQYKPFAETFSYNGFALLKLEKKWEIHARFPA